jgi:hypothetical protein
MPPLKLQGQLFLLSPSRCREGRKKKEKRESERDNPFRGGEMLLFAGLTDEGRVKTFSKISEARMS